MEINTPKDEVIELEGNVLNFLEAKRHRCGENQFDHCGPFIISDGLANVICKCCKREVNPIWLLNAYIKKFKRANRRIVLANKMGKELSERKKTKCTHCGKMTNIKLKNEN